MSDTATVNIPIFLTSHVTGHDPTPSNKTPLRLHVNIGIRFGEGTKISYMSERYYFAPNTFSHSEA